MDMRIPPRFSRLPSTGKENAFFVVEPCSQSFSTVCANFFCFAESMRSPSKTDLMSCCETPDPIALD